MLAHVSRECLRKVVRVRGRSGDLDGDQRSDCAKVVLGSPHVFKATRTRVIHIWRITERKKGLTLDWVWANSGSRIHCLCHKCLRTCQGTWPNPTSLSSVPTALCALLSYPLPLLFLSYVFDSATIRIPSAIRNFCSCTLSRIAAILLVSSFQLLFSLALCCYVFPAILRFSFLLSNSTFDYSYFFIFYFFIFFRPFFPLSLVFGFGFVIFFALSQLISVLFHFFPFLDVLSRVFRFDESTLFSTFSFYFFLSFASSASFESAFPRALFMSLALFHASFPSSSISSFTSFYPPSSL